MVCPPLSSIREPAAALNEPLWLPPPLSRSVPDCTSTWPELLKASGSVAMPVPADLTKRPALSKRAPAPPDKTLKSPFRSRVLPAALSKVPVQDWKLPAFQFAVPALCSVPYKLRRPAPNSIPPLAWTVPTTEPASQVNSPAMLSAGLARSPPEVSVTVFADEGAPVSKNALPLRSSSPIETPRVVWKLAWPYDGTVTRSRKETLPVKATLPSTTVSAAR